MLDATVGQNGVTQAREFTSVAGVNGIVLTKLDGTAKGGVAVAIANDLEAADSLRRRRRRHRRPGAVLRRRIRRRPVRREVVTPTPTTWIAALFHAERGRGRTSPNPLVGAVVVSPDGVVVGTGLPRARRRGARGSARARRWPARARAARRCYCTLEPCCHRGRTGPCVGADRRGRHRARRRGGRGSESAACDGRGFAYLRAHGVAVDVGRRRGRRASRSTSRSSR